MSSFHVAWRLLLLVALVWSPLAAAREMFPPGFGAAGALSSETLDALIRDVTENPDGQSLHGIFADQVPGRRIAVVPLAGFTVVKAGNPSKLRKSIEEQLGYPLPDEAAAELWHLATSVYANFGGAFVRQLSDGREYCIAMVGRPFENHEQFLSAMAGGSLRPLPTRSDFRVLEAGVQRFLAYHEVGGHCADPAFTPSTGRDATAIDGYRHGLAELRADIFAALALAHDDGDTEIDRVMLVLRRSYSLQAAAAPLCDSPVNYGAVYQTAPGILAAIRYAEAGRLRTLQAMSYAELLDLADRLREQVQPSFDAFEAFQERINRLREAAGSTDPFAFAREAARLAELDPQDRAWIEEGAQAVRSIFYLTPPEASASSGASGCQIVENDPEHQGRAFRQRHNFVGSAGLGG